MDKISKRNEDRWDDLVHFGVPCSRPDFKMTPEIAKETLDKEGIFGDLKGKKVLCLASGGGQQSIGFALLGAKVTVVDFSSEQLEKDKFASEKFSTPIRIIKADMRDLSTLADHEFDIVYQPYSINYVPEVNTVFDEVSRIIRPGGIYHLMFHNPFLHGSWKDGCWGGEWKKDELWKGKGYPIRQPYKEGHPIKLVDPFWNFTNSKGKKVRVKAPQEYKHTLSTVINGLIKRGFNILRFDEYKNNKFDSKPGTWEHYVSYAAPWLFLWARKG